MGKPKAKSENYDVGDNCFSIWKSIIVTLTSVRSPVELRKWPDEVYFGFSLRLKYVIKVCASKKFKCQSNWRR